MSDQTETTFAQCRGCKHNRKIEIPRCPGFVPKKAMRFVPSQDTTDEDDAKLRKHYGDCYGCKHHLSHSSFCLKSQCPLRYPIHGCGAREEGWA